jgi:hypothetical protein
MSIFHIHKWSKWSLATYRVSPFRPGQPVMSTKNRRRCERCNLVEVKDIDA